MVYCVCYMLSIAKLYSYKHSLVHTIAFIYSWNFEDLMCFIIVINNYSFWPAYSLLICTDSRIILILHLLSGVGELCTIGTAVGIAVATTAVGIFVAGVLAGILIHHCIIKHQSQNSKPESSSEQQQHQSSYQEHPAVLSSNPLWQTGPEYEEVVELRQNAAYELTQTGIELKVNEAYQHI